MRWEDPHPVIVEYKRTLSQSLLPLIVTITWWGVHLAHTPQNPTPFISKLKSNNSKNAKPKQHILHLTSREIQPPSHVKTQTFFFYSTEIGSFQLSPPKSFNHKPKYPNSQARHVQWLHPDTMSNTADFNPIPSTEDPLSEHQA